MVLADLGGPAYAAGTLPDVLPAVLASLGGPAPRRPDSFGMPPANRAVVVLVDGLGLDLLTARSGHAPWLRAHLDLAHRVACGYPSTTATSIGGYGTGLHPGGHGLVGYEVLDPDRDLVFNELSWVGGPAPEDWQRARTVFEVATDAGVPVTRIGSALFARSGLTRAALRGGEYVAAEDLASGVRAAIAAARHTPRALVHLYWPDVDKVGHVHGPQSWQWGAAVEELDAQLRVLAAGLPADCSLTITADHGMILVPHETRLDLAARRNLLKGVRHVAGEPRSLMLHTEPGAAERVRDRWREEAGERAEVLLVDEAIARGWFGEVDDRVRPRLGEVLLVAGPGFAVVDSVRQRPELLALKGMHGGLTPDEVAIPVLHVPAGVR